MATRDGTWAYRDEHGDRFARTYFRRFGGATVSSIGLGTYLGDPTDAADEGYREAAVAALESGINVLDTAINYRHQRSERVVGEAIVEASVDRDAVVVATKGGFVPFDGERPDDPGRWIRETYVEAGIVDAGDLVRGQHCITPGFVADQLDRSLANLGLDAIDCYYVHNPETQLEANDPADVYDQLEATFEFLETRAAAGDIGHYGIATWEAFRVEPDHPKHLSLAEIAARARAAASGAGNDATHFRAVQLPFNVLMADAFTVDAQGQGTREGDTAGIDSRGAHTGDRSALEFAHDAGLEVFTSATLAQGRLVSGLPEAVAARVPGGTPVERAINFARSAPGVTCSLVGMGSKAHVAENVAAGTVEPLGANAFDAIFE